MKVDRASFYFDQKLEIVLVIVFLLVSFWEISAYILFQD